MHPVCATRAKVCCGEEVVARILHLVLGKREDGFVHLPYEGRERTASSTCHMKPAIRASAEGVSWLGGPWRGVAGAVRNENCTRRWFGTGWLTAMRVTSTPLCGSKSDPTPTSIVTLTSLPGATETDDGVTRTSSLWKSDGMSSVASPIANAGRGGAPSPALPSRPSLPVASRCATPHAIASRNRPGQCQPLTPRVTSPMPSAESENGNVATSPLAVAQSRPCPGPKGACSVTCTSSPGAGGVSGSSSCNSSAEIVLPGRDGGLPPPPATYTAAIAKLRRPSPSTTSASIQWAPPFASETSMLAGASLCPGPSTVTTARVFTRSSCSTQLQPLRS